jgi:hypothetical protein
VIAQMRRPRRATTALFVALVVAPAASAHYKYPQNAATTYEEYKDYPQIRGERQPLTKDTWPSWMTLDGEFRSRTEDQTAINLLPGQGKFYELERIRGGMVHLLNISNCDSTKWRDSNHASVPSEGGL